MSMPMQMNEDAQYLRLLSIFHYVVGGLVGLISCFPIFHFIVGLGLVLAGLTQLQRSPEVGFMVVPGLMFVLIAGSIMLGGWTLAICIALTGYFLNARKRYMFCLVMAGIEMIFTPLGTVLGVFTVLVLVRSSVKTLFLSAG